MSIRESDGRPASQKIQPASGARLGLWVRATWSATIRGLAVGVASLAAVSLGAGVASAEDATRVEAGKALYDQYCGACHGSEADGKGPLAANLDPKPPDLRMLSAHHKGVFPDAEISRVVDGRDPVVGHGTRDMPVWGRKLGDSLNAGPGKETRIQGDISLMIAYLKSVQMKH
jgi:mono/diheme cytochrome c family protein